MTTLVMGWFASNASGTAWVATVKSNCSQYEHRLFWRSGVTIENNR